MGAAVFCCWLALLALLGGPAHGLSILPPASTETRAFLRTEPDFDPTAPRPADSGLVPLAFFVSALFCGDRLLGGAPHPAPFVQTSRSHTRTTIGADRQVSAGNRCH